MILVAIAWTYVALMMAVAEAVHPDGSLFGAVFTFLLYGVLPLSLVLYIMGTPARRRARRAADTAVAVPACDAGRSGDQPDAGGQAAAAAQAGLIPPVREKS